LAADEDNIKIGAVVIGDRGTIVYGSHGAGGARLIPEQRMLAYAKPAKTLPRTKGHHADWLAAIRNGTRAGSDFSYGGPLTEVALLGVIAIKLSPQKLHWDGPNARFTNCPEANQLLRFPHRGGWRV
jgi:hypothetical protein